MNDTPIKQLLLSNAYWVINKNVVKAIGLEPAFLLGIFAEAENKLADEEGWFFQTSAKITELTGLSNHKQTNAINKLIELNVLLQENRGVPCKRYFNGKPAKYDLRKWFTAAEPPKMLKGVTLTVNELKVLKDTLNSMEELR